MKKTRYRNVYKRPSGKYVYRYTDENGKKVQRTGTTSLEATEKLRSQAESAAALIRAGLHDPVLDKQRIGSKKPIDEVIEEYGRYLTGKQRHPQHVKTTKSYLYKITEAINANCLSEIQACKVDGFLADLVSANKSTRTRNAYLTAIKALMRWAKDRDMIKSNCLTVIHKENDYEDQRRPNRALTEEELEKLLSSVKPVYKAYYLLASKAGLRWEEIKKLCWRNLDLHHSEIILDAKNTKTKQRCEPLPMCYELAEALEAIKPLEANLEDRVFGFKPDRRTWIRQLKKAGIAYKDHNGRIADRKCLRETFVTHLIRNGVDSRIVQRLARHKDFNITMKHYTDPYLLDMRGAVEKLSRICHSENEIQATDGDELQHRKAG